MILQDTTNEIEQIGNITEQAEFSIKASKKAFSILSGMYSDIYIGIIREIGANALDSHIAAGKRDVPIEIHLPNALEPWLTIRDFGTGICHKDIYSIYTKYFESTKTNTNEQTGCFGLGSKIFFAYSDNSTIYSIVDGVKRIYNVFFNANGVPSISLMSQDKTDECNGLSVQIPVKTQDFDKFTNATYRACRFYDVKPNILGGKIDWNIENANFSGSFWQSYNKLNHSVALMGNVAYPIETYQVSYENQDIVRKAGLVINFNLGELEITPSRESLAYSEFTLKALNDKIELVKSDFVSKVEDTIEKSENLLDAMKALYMLNSQWSFLNSKLVSGKVLWKNIDITDPRRSIKAYTPNLLSVSKSTWGRKKYNESGFPSLDNEALWYVDDLTKGGYKRVLNFLRFSSDKISINFVSQSEMNVLINAGFPASIFNKTSDLAPVVPVNRVTGGTKNTRAKGIINVYTDGYSYNNPWDSVKFDLSKDVAPKYFIEKDSDGWGFAPITIKNKKGESLAIINNKKTINTLIEVFGIKIDEVRMVSKGNSKHLVALGSESLKDVLENKVVNVEIDDLVFAKQFNRHNIDTLVENKKFQELSDENEFRVFIEGVKNKLDSVKKYHAFSPYIKFDETKELTFPSKLVELLYASCEAWQIGIDKALDAAIEIDKALDAAIEIDKNK
jgi:hypothetical protein